MNKCGHQSTSDEKSLKLGHSRY